jgi:excisionase family DNA binding protein
MNENKFLDMDELAEYIKVSKSFLYKRVCYKTIPFIKLGTRTVFVREQIDQWVINGCQMEVNLPELPKL